MLLYLVLRSYGGGFQHRLRARHHAALNLAVAVRAQLHDVAPFVSRLWVDPMEGGRLATVAADGAGQWCQVRPRRRPWLAVALTTRRPMLQAKAVGLVRSVAAWQATQAARYLVTTFNLARHAALRRAGVATNRPGNPLAAVLADWSRSVAPVAGHPAGAAQRATLVKALCAAICTVIFRDGGHPAGTALPAMSGLGRPALRTRNLRGAILPGHRPPHTTQLSVSIPHPRYGEGAA